MILLRRIAYLALLLAFCFYPLVLLEQLHFADYDLFARLAVGRLFFSEGVVPLKDVFSFSPTKPIWYDHEWLAGIVFYWFLENFGAFSLLLFSCAAMVLTFFFLFLTQQRLTQAPLLGAVVLCIVAVLSIGMWAAVVRCQVGSFLFFAIVAYLLVELRNGARLQAIVGVPLCFLIWVNFHGGVIVGYGLLALTTVFSWIEWRAERYIVLIITLISVLMLLVNPYGIGYLGFLVEAIGKDRPIIDEWATLPLNPLTMIAQGHIGVVLFVPLVLIGSITHWRRIAKEHIVFTLIALFHGYSHLRLLPFFYCSAAIYFLPALVSGVERIPQATRDAVRTVTLFLGLPAAVYSGWLFASAYSSRATEGLNLYPYPVAPMQWLRCNYPGGTILSSFNSGSFVLWRGYPEFLVAVDGRFEEVYEDEVVEKVQIALSSIHRDHDKALREINPDFVIRCGRETSRVARAPWKVVYHDNRCRIDAKKVSQASRSSLMECREDSVWVPNF